MKKFFIGGIIATLLLLDWAALDDITTGNEPSFKGEYLTLFLSAIIFVVLIVYWLKHRNKKVVAVALIQNEKGEYLLIQSAKNFGKNTGKWYPPGGHLEKGETVQNCLKRELKEELNLEIKPVKQITSWKQDTRGEIGQWWHCNIVGGSIKKDSSITSFGFFPKEKIKEMNLWPATRKFFEKFIWK